ncbi:hypothetical protein [Hymenobacter guriensis]|uniref:Secreted protein n=1 Tax=Hymenobacter guriensis TaxID=2793065 RepID=A0ABS0L091_9BACT|nr:hypothetical protein [Hymenobacter guriensis]MBG8553531.1 hypothetical protein [Hymenobacter guriensis]
MPRSYKSPLLLLAPALLLIVLLGFALCLEYARPPGTLATWHSRRHVPVVRKHHGAPDTVKHVRRPHSAS